METLPLRPCHHFKLTGSCQFGDSCRFLHINSAPKSICRHFFNGNCVLGDKCRFLHENHLSSISDSQVCRHFLAGTCNLGSNCRFSHTSSNDSNPTFDSSQEASTNAPTNSTETPSLATTPNPCRHFLAGHCLLGERCRFVHVIPTEPFYPPLCRHYKTRGFCRLGDTCRFSHRDADAAFPSHPARPTDPSTITIPTTPLNSGNLAVSSSPPLPPTPSPPSHLPLYPHSLLQREFVTNQPSHQNQSSPTLRSMAMPIHMLPSGTTHLSGYPIQLQSTHSSSNASVPSPYSYGIPLSLAQTMIPISSQQASHASLIDQFRQNQGIYQQPTQILQHYPVQQQHQQIHYQLQQISVPQQQQLQQQLQQQHQQQQQQQFFSPTNNLRTSVCRHWLRKGIYRLGSSCKFSHPPELAGTAPGEPNSSSSLSPQSTPTLSPPTSIETDHFNATSAFDHAMVSSIPTSTSSFSPTEENKHHD